MTLKPLTAILRPALGAALVCAVVAVGSASPAAAQKKLVIATYGGEFAKVWRRAVAEPFEKETGIRTEIYEVPLPTAAVDGANGRPQFHLAIVGAYSSYRLEAAGKLENLSKADIPNLAAIPDKYLVKTAEGALVGVPVNFEYLGIAYNNTLAKASDFDSWRNLLDAKWKNQLSMSRPSFVAAYDLTLFSKLNGGDENNIAPGLPMVKALAGNVAGFYTSMSNLEAQLGRGEVVAAPFYSGNAVLLRNAGVKTIDITTPKEGGLLLPYLLVAPKGATDMADVKRLLDAILSPAYQLRLIQTGAWPINPQVKLSASDEALLGGKLEDAMARNYTPDWYVVGKNHPDRTRQIEALLQGQ